MATKKEKPKKVVAGNAPHVVYKKDKKVIVDHLGKKGGKWDKINLTKEGGAKTVKEGVKAVKSWHKDKPHKKDK
jgi:hypothetical protein